MLLTALGGRLFQLQVVNGDEFARRAAADRTVMCRSRAARLIFDREGRPVAVNGPSWTVKVRPADLPGAVRVTGSLRTSRESRAVTLTTFSGTAHAFQAHHTISCPSSAGSARDAALLHDGAIGDLPGSSSRSSRRGDISMTAGDEIGGALMAHVVGYTGPVNRDELERARSGRLPAR